MNKQTIYQKYGGFDFFHKIIYELYIELFDHLEISYHFWGVDLMRLSQRQTEFLCEAIGGPPMYKGQEIAQVHRYMKITDYEFETVAKRFADIFKKNGLDDSEVDFIMNFVRSKRPFIVNARNTLIDRIMRFIYKRIKKFNKILSKLGRK